MCRLSTAVVPVYKPAEEVKETCVAPDQAARVSADAVAAAVTLTNDCIKDGNAVEATSKAAASAWRSSQARTHGSLHLWVWGFYSRL